MAEVWSLSRSCPSRGRVGIVLSTRSVWGRSIDLIREGREQYGSQTFDQHLMELVESRMVEFELAKAASNSPSDFDLKMNILGGRWADGETVKPGSELGGFTT